jgi:hypothetical protein
LKHKKALPGSTPAGLGVVASVSVYLMNNIFFIAVNDPASIL